MKLFATALALALALLGCETLEPNPGPQPGGGGGADFGVSMDFGGGFDAGFDPGEPGDGGVVTGADGQVADPGIDGRLLYLRYCAICHGPDGTGGPSWPETIRGLTDTWEVVHEGRGEMPAFPSLSPADVLAIERFLAGDPGDDPGPVGGDGGLGPVDELPPLTPQEVYATTCAVCHGVAGDGTARGPQIRFPVRDYATWVVRNGRAGFGFAEPMPAFGVAQVSEADLSAILDWLGGFERPVTGDGLYRAFCGNCHGEGGFGGWVDEGIRGEPFSEYLEVVREGEGGRSYWDREEYMPWWSPAALSDAEVMQIWLAVTGGVPGDDDDDHDEDHDEDYDEDSDEHSDEDDDFDEYFDEY